MNRNINCFVTSIRCVWWINVRWSSSQYYRAQKVINFCYAIPIKNVPFNVQWIFHLWLNKTPTTTAATSSTVRARIELITRCAISMSKYNLAAHSTESTSTAFAKCKGVDNILRCGCKCRYNQHIIIKFSVPFFALCDFITRELGFFSFGLQFHFPETVHFPVKSANALRINWMSLRFDANFSRWKGKKKLWVFFIALLM